MIVLVLRAFWVKVRGSNLLFLCNLSNAFSKSFPFLCWREPMSFLVPDESVWMEALIYLSGHVLKLLKSFLKVVGIIDILPKTLLISKCLSGTMKI